MNPTHEILSVPLRPWKVRGEGHELSLEPVPGTWTLAPEELCLQGIRAAIVCPNRECNTPALIPADLSRVGGSQVNGCAVIPTIQCVRCKAVYGVRLLRWDTKKLYCVAYEVWENPELAHGRKEYLHAESRADALLAFSAGTGFQLTQKGYDWKIAECGIALGFFGNEEKDKDLLNLSV